MHSLDDTIVAIASAPGGAARGIVRLSGPLAVACVQSCFRPEGGGHDTPAGPYARAGELTLAGWHSTVPGWAYVWPGTRSYTRQPTVELHLPGSAPVLEAAVEQLRRAGARLANPGEFTLRAFLAGRIDLTQAEAVLGVIDARGDAELRVALGQLAGGLATPLQHLRGALLDLLAELEAGLDFVEEDIELISSQQLQQRLDQAAAELDRLIERVGKQSQRGWLPTVLLVGRPNAGKSSLFNALLGGPQAIVSEVAGTTRDYLAAGWQADGVACRLVDTAGAVGAAPRDDVEAQAQQLAESLHERAALLLVCCDSAKPLTDAERHLLCGQQAALLVRTKADRQTPPADDPPRIVTSASTGLGLDELARQVARRLDQLDAALSGVVANTALRAAGALQSAQAALSVTRRLAADQGDETLVAGEIRLALHALGEVAGAVYTDDVLDRIFSRFCIGK